MSEEKKDLFPEVAFDALHDHVLVQKIEKDKTPSGIALPPGADTDWPKVLVLKVGPGKNSDFDGSLIPMHVKQGDVCYLIPSAYSQRYELPVMNFGTRKCHLVRERDIAGFQTKVPKVTPA